ncbi:hypothetical protein [Nocardia sp. NPDC005998]|uniref:hypothetical protein n=1 Tax=Nocardia sp. NPDC005998 TaxID=3156894 RepID=UPI0033BB28C0
MARAAVEEPATATPSRSVPSFALLTTADKDIPIEAQRFMTERAGARTVEVAASHAVAISVPEAVRALIMAAVRS